MDVERPAGVVRVLAVPDHAGEPAKLRPITERSAGEVDQRQPSALLDEAPEIGPGLLFAIQRLLVAEVEQNHVVLEDLIGGEDFRVLADPYNATAALFQDAAEGRRRLPPAVRRVIHSGDEQH